MAKTVIVVVVVAIELLFKLGLYLEESRKVTFPLREDLQVIKSISGS
jgi:preprotein translocase subunit SecE